MAKTVILMGSPRLQSNTDILTHQLMEGMISAGAEPKDLKKYDLVEYQSYVCCACGQCRAAGACLQFPQVDALLQTIRQADSLVLATPTWWLGPSSYMKILIDHWGAFLRPDYTSRIAGKKAAVISCCGNPDVNLADKVCGHLAEILGFLQTEVVGTLAIKGVTEVGAVERNPKALTQAFELGEKLQRR